MSGSPEYKAWWSMIKRCHDEEDKSYPDYGGRGITVSDVWRVSFDAFLQSVGPRPSPDHSLDRINNEKGYEHGNVRWATRSEQQANKRDTIYLEYRGTTYPRPVLLKRFNISVQLFKDRRQRGLTIEAALETPIKRTS